MSELLVEDIHVAYNGIQTAVEGVSLRVAPGQLVVLLGSNGAGKTTTLRAISGFLPMDRARVTRGRVTMESERINGLPPSAVVRRGVTLVPEREKVFAAMTVDENLRVVGRHADADGLAFVHGVFPILKERSAQAAGFLSGGERQMLAIARALLLRPKVMLIDELSFGLAPLTAQNLLHTVRNICKERQVGVLVVEQNAAAGLAVADFAYIMERGRVVHSGTPATLQADSAVRDFYFGLGESGMASYIDPARERARRKAL